LARERKRREEKFGIRGMREEGELEGDASEGR
jgi:hypothetical protein